MKYKIISNEMFEQELQKIVFYISYFLNEPQIATKFKNDVKNKISTLEYFPEGYPKVYYNNSNIRKVFVKNYIIIYEVLKSKRRSSHFTYLSFKSKLFKKILRKSKKSLKNLKILNYQKNKNIYSLKTKNMIYYYHKITKRRKNDFRRTNRRYNIPKRNKQLHNSGIRK